MLAIVIIVAIFAFFFVMGKVEWVYGTILLLLALVGGLYLAQDQIVYMPGTTS